MVGMKEPEPQEDGINSFSWKALAAVCMCGFILGAAVKGHIDNKSEKIDTISCKIDVETTEKDGNSVVTTKVSGSSTACAPIFASFEQQTTDDSQDASDSTDAPCDPAASDASAK